METITDEATQGIDDRQHEEICLRAMETYHVVCCRRCSQSQHEEICLRAMETYQRERDRVMEFMRKYQLRMG